MGCGCEDCGGYGAVVGLAHVGIIVGDMERSLEFYTDTLGFECYHKAEIGGADGATKLSFLRCGTCEIELVMPPRSGARKDGTVDHIALRVNDIDEMMRNLLERGVKFETEKPADLPMLFDNGVKCAFFRGPDGERIELSEEL
jgi:lactoylglutathione lyase